MDYPINPEIVRKNRAIPGLIAKLSYTDENAAIEYIRQYGEMTVPVTPLYDDITEKLGLLKGGVANV